MVKRLTMILAGALMFSATALAQNKVTGTVISQDDGEPIVGASVMVNGTKTGTVTDVNGNFTLDVKPGQKLHITYLGMNPQDVTVNGKTLRVAMSADNQSLDEVVVTALGIKQPYIRHHQQPFGYCSWCAGEQHLWRPWFVTEYCRSWF